MNNPLKYTDPSGEFFFSAFLGPLGAMIDAACWAAVTNAATQAVMCAAGWQKQFDWGSVAGTFASSLLGNITAGFINGIGEAASLGFGNNALGVLSKYTFRAASAFASTWVSSQIYSMATTGHWDDRSATKAACWAAGLTLIPSAIEYITWDSHTSEWQQEYFTNELNDEMNKKGLPEIDVFYLDEIKSGNQTAYGIYMSRGNPQCIEIEEKLLLFKNRALITGMHEINHYLSDINNTKNFGQDWFKKSKGLPFEFFYNEEIACNKYGQDFITEKYPFYSYLKKLGPISYLLDWQSSGIKFWFDNTNYPKESVVWYGQ
jgi:hypothetical protein